MNVLRLHHTLRASLRTHFPGLVYWSHLPGLVSWFAVSFGIILNKSIFPDFNNYFIIPLPILLIVLSFTGFGGILLHSNKFRIPLFIMFGFVVHFFYASQTQHFFTRVYNLRYVMKKTTITGRVVSSSNPYFGQNSYHFRIITQPEIYHSPLIGKKVRCISDQQPALGSIIKVSGSFIPPKPRQNPYGFDQREYFLSNRLWGSLYADSITISDESIPFYYHIATHFRGAVMKTLATIKKPENRALFQSAFLGERSLLTSEMKNNFRKAGIYHLLAISGLHVGILFASAYFLFNLLPIGTRTKGFCALLIVWLYLLFIGFIPSLFRATIMITFLFGTPLFQRNNYPLHSLGLAGTLWLLVSPGSITQPGYQLSFAATFGILTLFPILTPKKKKNTTLVTAIGYKIWALFAVSVAGLLATVPVLLYHFGGFSLFGLFANLVSVVLMTIGMWCFFAGLLLHPATPLLSRIPLVCAEFATDSLRAIAHFAENIPFSWFQLPSPPTEITLLYILFLIGFINISRKAMGPYLRWSLSVIFVVTPILLLHHTSSNSLEIVRFAPHDLGCIGVRWPDRTVWLFMQNAEESFIRHYDNCIVPWLRHNGKNHPDIICVPPYSSHYHYPSDSVATGLKKRIFLTSDICSETTIINDEMNCIIPYPFVFTPSPSCTVTVNDPNYKNNGWMDITYGTTRMNIAVSSLTVSDTDDSLIKILPVSNTADRITVSRSGFRIY